MLIFVDDVVLQFRNTLAMSQRMKSFPSKRGGVYSYKYQLNHLIKSKYTYIHIAI